MMNKEPGSDWHTHTQSSQSLECVQLGLGFCNAVEEKTKLADPVVCYRFGPECQH